MPPHTNVVINAYTPAQTIEQVGRAGVKQANMRIDKIFMASVMAGMYLSFACASLLLVNASPWFQDNAPGLIRMFGAIIFPFGLCLMILTGTHPCTGSFMTTTVAVLQRRLPIWKALVHWFVTFWGNLAGSLFVMAIITGYGETFNTPVFQERLFAFNETKVVTPSWHAIFLRGIGANWLVCMGIWLHFMAREYSSKILALWWPTFAFVMCAFDHVIANMFFVPTSIFYGDPEISVSLYIWKSLIPSLLGNIIGGGLFVGTFFWYMYCSSEGPIAVDGVYFPGDEPIVAVQSSASSSSGENPAKPAGEKSPEQMV